MPSRVSRAALAAFLLAPATAVAQPTAADPPAQPGDPTTPPPPEATPSPEAPPAPAPLPEPEPPAIPPEAPPAPPPEAAKADEAVSWRYDKGFIAATADERFELKAGLRTQVRFDAVRAEAKDEFENRFSLPRIRLQLEGFAYGKENTYKVEYDLSNNGYSALKDFFVERAFAPQVRLRLGQYKKPFSRQEIVSDFALAYVERAAVGGFFGAGRDLGLQAHSNLEKSADGVEWAVGVFNGTTEKSKIALTCPEPEDPAAPIDPATCVPGLPSNVPGDFLPELVARVGFNFGGIKGYSELDLEGGPLRFAVGAAYRTRLNEVDQDLREQAAQVDAIVKVEGFDLSGAAFWQKKGEADAEIGGYGQAGFVAVPKILAIAARFGLTPIDAISEQRLEMLGAINLFANGHNQKLVVDGGVLKDTEKDTNDVVVRAQAQLVF